MVNKGFTLVELLVVITVLAVLAAGMMIFINPAKRFKQANDARIKSDINQIANALVAYYTLNRHYPAGAEGLAALTANGDLKTIPSPPTGGEADYSYDASNACVMSPYTGCEAVVYYALRDPQAEGNVWCWRSAVGTAVEAAACTP